MDTDLPKRWSILFLLALFVSIGCRQAAGAPPVIVRTSEGVQAYETFLVFGDGFDAELAEARAWFPKKLQEDSWETEWNDDARLASAKRCFSTRPKLPPAPPDDSEEMEVLRCTTTFVALRLKYVPETRHWRHKCETQMIWVRNKDGWSAPWRANAPTIWWVERPYSVFGQRLRIFGRNLLMVWKYPQWVTVALRSADGSVRILDWSYSESVGYDIVTPQYTLTVHLPSDLRPGKHQLIVHNGSGGDYGWSEPFEIEVAAAKEPPSRLVSGRSAALRGDGLSDETKTLQRALDGMAAEGGGTLVLNPGSYVISHTIAVPEGVSIRGVSRDATAIRTSPEYAFSKELPPAIEEAAREWHPSFREKPPMLWVRSQTTLSDLTLLGDHGAPLCILLNGEGQNVRLHRLGVENRTPAEYAHGGYARAANCLLCVCSTTQLEIVGCNFIGMCPIAFSPSYTRWARIADNTIRQYPANADNPTLIRDIAYSIVEDNRVIDGRRGILFQPQFQHRPQMALSEGNFWARNIVRNTWRGKNGNETFINEVCCGFWTGRVKSSAPNSLTGLDAKWETSIYRGALCVIHHGRGFGQIRRILNNTEDTLTLTEPWIVKPDTSSAFTITTGGYRNIFLNNRVVDGGGPFHLWGSWFETVNHNFVATDGGMQTFWGIDGRAQFGRVEKKHKALHLCYFNDVLACRFIGAGVLFIGALTDTKLPDVGPLTAGNTLRRSLVDASHPRNGSEAQAAGYEPPRPNTLWEDVGAVSVCGKVGRFLTDVPELDRFYAPCYANLIEGNKIEGPGRPIRVTGGARDTLIINNLLTGEIRDTGHDTMVLSYE